ncbi:MAG: FAD-dependent oxidoreductase [Sandaracinaceae bacterium]
MGRLKDLLIVAGRNVYPDDIEDSVRTSHPNIRPGGVAAVSVAKTPVDPDELAVLIESKEKRPAQHVLEAMVEAARAAVVNRHQIVPRAVVVLRGGALLKTTSGKIRRQACARALVDGHLDGLFSLWRDPHEPAVVVDTTPASEGAVESQGDLLGIVHRIAAETIGASLEDVDVDTPVTHIGLSSLLVLDFVDRLEAALGISLPPSLLFGQMSLRDLSDQLSSGTDPAEDDASPRGKAPLLLGRANDPRTTRVGIIGGGVSGLTAAARLVEMGYRHVTLFEAEAQVGGKVLTAEVAGEQIELGAMLLSSVSEETRATLGDSWKEGDFQGHVITLGTPTKPPVLVERDHFWPWLTRFVRADEATPVEDDDQPLLDWLEEHDLLADMTDLHKLHWTGFGYGALGAGIPSIYFRRYFRQYWPPHAAGVFTKGHQRVWQHLAARLEREGARFHVSCPVKAVTRGPHDVLVETADGTAHRFDELVVTAPPRLALEVLDVDAEEKALLSAVTSLVLRLTVCRVDGLDGYAYALDDVERLAPGDVISVIHQRPGISVISQHPIVPETGERVAEALLAEKRERFVRELGGRDVQVLMEKDWSYFPHFPSNVNAMEHAFERLQGVRRTWFLGSYLGMEIVKPNNRLARGRGSRAVTAFAGRASGQLRTWVMHQLAPDDPSYRIQIEIHITGRSIATVFDALDTVVMRHDALRMTIVRDGATVLRGRGSGRDVERPRARVPRPHRVRARAREAHKMRAIAADQLDPSSRSTATHSRASRSSRRPRRARSLRDVPSRRDRWLVPRRAVPGPGARCTRR